MKFSLQTTSILLLLIFNSTVILAGGVYQEPADFIKQIFINKPPKTAALWLDKDLKKQISEILDHDYNGLRIRYWQQDKRSAWVLDEVGKEKQITAGIVINNSQIERVKILVFRENRGWEIRHDFFTEQFKQAKLENNRQLDKSIDNISGATLSVRAIRKLATIALLLDQHIKHDQIKNDPVPTSKLTK